MKKLTFIAMVALSAFASGTFAETKDFTITAPDQLLGFESGNYDYNIYLGTSAGRARLGTTSPSDYQVYSLTLKQGDGITTFTPTFTNMLGEFTLNNTLESGVFTAFKNETGNYAYLQMGSITIRNTVEESTATALFDLGSSYFLLQGNANAQKPTLNILMDTKIASTYNAGFGLRIFQNSKINVKNNSTLTVDTTTSVSSAKPEWPILITVDEGSTLTLNKAATFGNSTTLNVAGTLNGSGNFSFNQGSTLTAATVDRRYGALTISNGATATIDTLTFYAGRYLTVGGSLEVKSNLGLYQTEVTGKLTQSAGDSTVFNRYANFKTDSEFSTTGAVMISSGSTDPTSATFATITVDADNKLFNINATDARIIFKNGKLILNRENAVMKSDSTFARIVTTNSSSLNILEIGASQTFREIYANGSDLNLYIANPDAVLTTGLSLSSSHDLIIHDFVDLCLKVNNYQLIADPNTFITAYRTIEGTEVKVDKLYFTTDGFVTSIAVPEPAEWAAIFGALALAIAIYRRRK